MDKGDGLQRWPIALLYIEVAHLLSYHWKQMEDAAAHRNFKSAEFHKLRHEELHAVLTPPRDMDDYAATADGY
jgi:hypothetical protein